MIITLVALEMIGGIIYASILEWLLHRYIMHRPFFGFRYPFTKHALIHHHIFKADHTYHLIHDKDKKTIPMAWWNCIAILTMASPLPTILALVFKKWSFFLVPEFMCLAYYGVYEYFHWCMHLPRGRNVERSGIFFRLNGHHLLHHRYMNKNFNVVMPLADLFLGTLLLRSRVHFKQATGPSVPNVQPRASFKPLVLKT